MQSDPEFVELALAPEEAAEFRADAEELVSNYFRLEDPDAVDTVGMELGVERPACIVLEDCSADFSNELVAF